MALQINDTSYSGKYADIMIKQAVYSMQSIEKGLLYVKSGIKKMFTIPRVDMTNPLSPRQTTPTDDGSNPIVIDGRTLIPLDIEAYREINPRDFETNQMSEQLSETILAREVPPGIQSQLMQLLLNKSGEQFENMVWNGSVDYKTGVDKADPRYQLQFFDGLLKLMVNDPLVNLSSIGAAAITAVPSDTTYILKVLDDLITQAATKKKALVSNKGHHNRMKFILSVATEQLYLTALSTATTYKGISLDSPLTPRWKGYEVEGVAGMADNTIVFCQANADDPQIANLWVGMNSLDDNELKVARVAPLSEEFGMLAKWKWCVNYGWGNQIFLFTTLSAASFRP